MLKVKNKINKIELKLKKMYMKFFSCIKVFVRVLIIFSRLTLGINLKGKFKILARTYVSLITFVLL